MDLTKKPDLMLVAGGDVGGPGADSREVKEIRVGLGILAMECRMRGLVTEFGTALMDISARVAALSSSEILARTAADDDQNRLEVEALRAKLDEIHTAIYSAVAAQRWCGLERTVDRIRHQTAASAAAKGLHDTLVDALARERVATERLTTALEGQRSGRSTLDELCEAKRQSEEAFNSAARARRAYERATLLGPDACDPEDTVC